MTSLAIVTLNYGNPADTVELYNSFMCCENRQKIKFIVVDNGSGEIFVDQLINGLNAKKISASEYAIDNGLLLLAHLNGGYASGNNVGIKYGIEHFNLRHLWLLNNDTLLSHDSIDLALEAVKNFPLGILGATLIYHEDSKVQCLGGARFNKISFKGEYIGEGKSLEMIKETNPDEINDRIDYIHGASMIIPASVIYEVGMLSEKYFLYFEEIDFCLKLKDINIDLIWIPNLVIRHKDGAAINGRSYRYGKSKISEYHSMRSSLIFAKTWYPERYVRVAVVRILGKFVMNLIARNWKLIGVNFKAFCDLECELSEVNK